MNAILLGLSFLTRLPLPAARRGDQESLGASVRVWPFAGAIVALAGIAGMAVGAWGVSGPVGAVFAVGAMALVSGGLHLDGLSDCIDGLYCGGDEARKLAVMKDPHVGALGAAGTALWLMLKVALVLACIERGTAGQALWTACILARGALPLEILLGEPATPGKGLYATIKGAMTTLDAVAAVLFTLVLLLPGVFVSPETGGALAVGLVAAVTASFTWSVLWREQIGGLNGDVLGAASEIREAVVLAAMASPFLS